MSPDEASPTSSQTGLPYGSYIGAGAGHVLGFWQRHERRLGYQALDEARVQDYIVTETEMSRVLLGQQENTRRTLLHSLQKDER